MSVWKTHKRCNPGFKNHVKTHGNKKLVKRQENLQTVILQVTIRNEQLNWNHTGEQIKDNKFGHICCCWIYSYTDPRYHLERSGLQLHNHI